jgi:hypothetical protein
VGCRNKATACFVDSTNGERHLPIDASDLQKWNIEIRLGKATIELPPDPVRVNMNQKGNKVHALKNKSNSAASTVIHNHLHIPTPFRGSHRRASGSHHASKSQLQSETESSPPTPLYDRPSRMAMRSSPVGSDPDPDNAITEYIQWHIGRTPKHTDLLNDAKVKLLAEGVTLQTLRNMKNEDFKGMDIRVGIGMRLHDDVKDWTNVHRKRIQDREKEDDFDFEY